MSGLITFRIVAKEGVAYEETVPVEHNEIDTISKRAKILFRDVKIEILFDPPVQFIHSPKEEPDG